MAQELATALNVDEVRFIPSAHPPHKTTPRVTAHHRVQMVQLGIENNPIFKLDERELLRDGPSYTIDTLQSLRDELGDASLVLFMGSDAFKKLNTWHRWEEIIALCHIALVQRPAPLPAAVNGTLAKESLSKLLETFLQRYYTQHGEDLQFSPAGFITMQPVTALEIAATCIRQALQQKKSVQYLLPDNVIDYINRHQLYTA